MDEETFKEFTDLLVGHMKDNPSHLLHVWFGEWSGARSPEEGLNAYCTYCNWWNQVLT